MQTFELAAMIVFLVMYIGSALRAITAPEQYRSAEIAFYKSGKPAMFELLSFVLTGAAFALLILHFVLETARLSQIVLYAMIILFDVMLPLHFTPFFRDRMAGSLKQKTPAQYRNSGWKRMAIGAAIILIPIIYG
ncbi:MAG: hypothetical protein IH600_06055 [Bacteroidetes bacterium]|nr:hypothetical protein [Bacteroidota bacterium]